MPTSIQGLLPLLIVIVITCIHCEKRNAPVTTTNDSINVDLVKADHPDNVAKLSADFKPKEIYLEIMLRSEREGLDTLPSDIRLNYTKEEIQWIQHKNLRLKTLTNDDLLDLYEKSFGGKKVIYGVDNRENVIYGPSDIIDISNNSAGPFIRDAGFVVAIIPKGPMYFDSKKGKYVITTNNTFKVFYRLCETERFLDQPVISHCTGFAATPDKIVTAGHCIDKATVKNYYFVFDLVMNKDGTFNPLIKPENVYEGIECIESKQKDGVEDFAVVKVNRPIPDYRIPQINKDNNLVPSTQFHVIGSAAGLPLKIAYNAVLRDNKEKNFFVINSDTYGGNSGSPVINSTSHQVEGILVEGEKDFDWITLNAKRCQVSVICPFDGCRGETVSRNLQYLKYLTMK